MGFYDKNGIEEIREILFSKLVSSDDYKESVLKDVNKEIMTTQSLGRKIFQSIEYDSDFLIFNMIEATGINVKG